MAISMLWFKNPSLSRDYFIFSIAVSVVVMVVLGCIVWNTYTAYLRKIVCQLETDLLRVEQEIGTIFDDIAHIQEYLGREIIKHNNPSDLPYILSTFKNVSKINLKASKVLALNSSFVWITPQDLQVVNLIDGIVPRPYDMSHRSYTKRCKEHPWTLQTAEPSFGIPSGLWLIPAATGITDSKGKHIGTIAGGFIIHSLAETIRKILHPSLAHFVLLDGDFEAVLDSSGNLNHKNAYHLRQQFSKNVKHL